MKNKIKCIEFPYRRNIKTSGRTESVVIDVEKLVILKPSRQVRSRTYSHGYDVYCLPEDLWGRVVVVILERSNSGKISHHIITYGDDQKIRELKEQLDDVLSTSKDFDEMVGNIVMLVRANKLQ